MRQGLPNLPYNSQGIPCHPSASVTLGVWIPGFQINPLFLLLYLNCAGLNSAEQALDVFSICFFTPRALISSINALSGDPAHQGLIKFPIFAYIVAFPFE